MYPFSPWARPVGSFPIPLSPPAAAGGSCSTLSVQFPSEWLPYIIGALQQLTLQSTWKGTQAEIQDAQAFAASIIGNIQHAVCVTGAEAPGVSGDCEDCMCCLRWNNGVLQVRSCGVWTDVPGGGPINPGTPSAGQPQPAANGGSQSICLDLIANQTVPLGVNVSSGDTLLLSNLSGTWRDVTSLLGIINCPDGYIYVEGACVADFPSGSPDPVPGALHMGIIAYIDGTAYDVTGVGPFVKDPVLFTVPGGISNKPVFFQANIDSLQNANGNVSFCVEVTNNKPGAWTQVFDFTIAPYASFWQIDVQSGFSGPDGVFVPGTGYQQALVDTPADGGITYREIVLNLLPPSAFDMTSIEVDFTYTGGTFSDTSDNTFDLSLNGGSVQNVPMPTTPTSPQAYSTPTTVSNAQIVLCCGKAHPIADPGGDCVITKIIISGTGTNPFA